MPIKAEIIADSFNPCGNRLTTFVLEYPRFVHSELLTHRTFSKNAASSRAIPIEKMIEQVMANPALPEFWGKNQSGMQAVIELDDTQKETHSNYEPNGTSHYNHPCLISEREAAKRVWLTARNKAVEYVKELAKIGLHKQIANRVLEPWFHIRVILSGTEFENFFALRAHKDAQPEIRILAEKMLKLYNASEPKYLKAGGWHIPFGDKIDLQKLAALHANNSRSSLLGDLKIPSLDELKTKIAIARCARISYFNYEGKDDFDADIKLCDRLFASDPKHLSPAEHVAMALDGYNVWSGNFRGFKQYRKFFDDNCLPDPRVIKKFKK